MKSGIFCLLLGEKHISIDYWTSALDKMEPCELEFIGENETIGIIPNFTLDNAIHLISGSIGPFRAGLPVHVPLWLAIHLRKQQKCRIVPPAWMERDILEEIKEAEKRMKIFTKMPSEHYMIEAQLILKCAAEDVAHSEEIRTAIKDIIDIRAAKLRTSMDDFMKGDGTYAKLDNLTVFEIHSVRPLLPYSLDLIDRLSRKVDDRSHQSSHFNSTANFSLHSNSNV